MGMKGIKKLKENGFRSSAPILKKNYPKRIKYGFLEKVDEGFPLLENHRVSFPSFFSFFFFCGPFSSVFILTPSMRLSIIYFRFPVTEHTHQSSSWRSYLSVAGPASANVSEFHGHSYRGLRVV